MPQRGAALLLLAALTACAEPVAQVASPVVAPPALIDGRYRGIARLTHATIAGCPRSGARIIVVEGNALSLNYRGPRASYALAAIVSPNGEIHGSDGLGTIEGQISGRHMDVTVASQYCETRYALDRV